MADNHSHVNIFVLFLQAEDKVCQLAKEKESLEESAQCLTKKKQEQEETLVQTLEQCKR